MYVSLLILSLVWHFYHKTVKINVKEALNPLEYAACERSKSLFLPLSLYLHSRE